MPSQGDQSGPEPGVLPVQASYSPSRNLLWLLADRYSSRADGPDIRFRTLLSSCPSSCFLNVVLLKRDVVPREIMTRELRWAVSAARAKEPHCDPCGDFLQVYSPGCVRSFTVTQLPARNRHEVFREKTCFDCGTHTVLTIHKGDPEDSVHRLGQPVFHNPISGHLVRLFRGCSGSNP